jgi:hypothetical protein
VQEVTPIIGPPVIGETLWFDASRISGVSNGSALASWPDLSGGGFDVSATGTARPTYTTGAVNGLPAVIFNGSTHQLARTGLPMNTAQPWTVAAVAIGLDVSGNSRALFTASDLVGSNAEMYKAISYGIQAGAGRNSTDSAGTGLHCVIAVFNGAASTIRTDAHTVTVAASIGTNKWLGNLYVGFDGSSTFWQGTVCELIFYPFILTTPQQDTLQASLKTKWGTP